VCPHTKKKLFFIITDIKVTQGESGPDHIFREGTTQNIEEAFRWDTWDPLIKVSRGAMFPFAPPWLRSCGK